MVTAEVVFAVVLAQEFDPVQGFTRLLWIAVALLVLVMLGRGIYALVRYRWRKRRERDVQGSGRRSEWAEPPDRGDDRRDGRRERRGGRKNG